MSRSPRALRSQCRCVAAECSLRAVPIQGTSNVRRCPEARSPPVPGKSLSKRARVCRQCREPMSAKMIQVLSLAGHPAATVWSLTYPKELHCTFRIAESETAESSVQSCLLPFTHFRTLKHCRSGAFKSRCCTGGRKLCSTATPSDKSREVHGARRVPRPDAAPASPVERDALQPSGCHDFGQGLHDKLLGEPPLQAPLWTSPNR